MQASPPANTSPLFSWPAGEGGAEGGGEGEREREGGGRERGRGEWERREEGREREGGRGGGVRERKGGGRGVHGHSDPIYTPQTLSQKYHQWMSYTYSMNIRVGIFGEMRFLVVSKAIENSSLFCPCVNSVFMYHLTPWPTSCYMCGDQGQEGNYMPSCFSSPSLCPSV